MTVPFLKIGGRIVEQADRSLLIIDDSQEVVLRFAVLEPDSGIAIFPEVILDDWGTEISDLALYKWLEEHGDQFPRAEVFGYQPSGLQIQRFVKELDLIGGYRCYAYASDMEDLNRGKLITNGIIQSEKIGAPRRTDPPDSARFPLSRAVVRWWLADSDDQEQMEVVLEQGLRSENSNFT